ncbi:MAG: DUF4097 domain-containing protein [Candidatus Zixiibacteriota bacterium]
MKQLRSLQSLTATVLFVGGSLLLLVAREAEADEFAYQYQKIIEAEAPVLLHLNLVRGKVHISGGEEGQVIIEAVKRVRAANEEEAEEVADHIEIRVASSASDVTINTNYLKMLSRSPSFWQKVLGSGSDSYGTVDYTISVPARSSIGIKSMAADIELSNIEGEIVIDNTVGSTRGEFLFGPITVRQSQGEIDLQWIEGDIHVRSSSSTVAIKQVHGAIDVFTQTGNVNIQTELTSPRDYFVETTSGAITFSIPEAASGLLRMETQEGAIQTEVPIIIKSVAHRRVVGEIGMGGPTITLSTLSGDVTLARY